jgi:CO/xanthine dehydrogenase Mo-binding subunit
MIESIDTSKAMLIDGVEAVFTYLDVDQNGKRFTCAGQTYPEASPQDRLILDRHVRFVGDVAAIVAAKSEQAAQKALKLIKVKYEVLPAILDFETAKDNSLLVHPENNWVALCKVGGDNKRNLCAHDESSNGDIEKVLASCDVVIDKVYHTKACQQTMMEPFTTFCNIDMYGRLNVVSSTQIVFHCRRIISNALGIPKTMVRVSKPRIGGGFGAKQTSVSEIYPAFVTWKTKKPSKIVFTREECMTASSPRHEMQMHVRLGASKDGVIRGIDLHTLSNTGAYGEHGPTTVGLSGHKSIPLYGRAEAFRFVTDVVYTNRMSAGAYRGYGATQGQFAVESAVNELAQILHIDPFDLRLKNMVKEGDVMPAYYNEMLTSCALDRCLNRVRQMIGWDKKGRVREVADGKVRTLGMAMSMQGSGIGGMDVGGATIRLGDDGLYNLSIAAADMGTGCDTILAQIAAEVLDCSVDNISVFGADTDASPYDSGSYASSTTYVTGKATELCAIELREKIINFGAQMLKISPDDAQFDGEKVTDIKSGKSCSLKDIATASMNGNSTIEATHSHSSKSSPPPFMVGACELEVDVETGEVSVIEFDAAVDCGTPVNPNLARVQAEGGILQGIGMALSENIQYTQKGVVMNNSLMQYKIPTRMDIGKINVAFESSYENQGPFGAKSIGEVVINTPLASIADALSIATGVRFTELPIMPEQIALKKQFFDKK